MVEGDAFSSSRLHINIGQEKPLAWHLHLEQQEDSSRSPPLPKMEFPMFDGLNPRLRKDRCEQYFEVYSISDSLKPCFAVLNFVDVAANWLFTYEVRKKITSWEELCSAVCEHFDRDQYQVHMK